MSSIKRGLRGLFTFRVLGADCTFSTAVPRRKVLCSSTRAAPSLGEHADTRVLRGVAVHARGQGMRSATPRVFPPTLTLVFATYLAFWGPTSSAHKGMRVRHANDKSVRDARRTHTDEFEGALSIERIKTTKGNQLGPFSVVITLMHEFI